MPTPLPYVVAPKNIEQLFVRIAGAKVPDAFTHNYLYQTLGLKGSNDRKLIPLLRTLGFIDASGKPTPEYSLLKNDAKRRFAIGDAVKRAYAPLFEANERANELPQDQLRGLIGQVAGTDQDLTSRIAGTFNALAKLAQFSDRPTSADEEALIEEPVEKLPLPPSITQPRLPTLKPDFHYNIQIHLPGNATEEVYLNIFNALRKVFQ